MNTTTALLTGAELAKAVLAAWFQFQRQAGLSEAELDKMLSEARSKFYGANAPDSLPDP